MGGIYAGVGVGDFDSDGGLETVGAQGNSLIALNGENGSLGWITLWGSTDIFGFKPTLVDITGNSRLDVIFVDGQGHLGAFIGPNGTFLWSRTLSFENIGAVACADMDGDGQVELVVCGVGVAILKPQNAGFRVYWEGHSGNQHFRVSNLSFNILSTKGSEHPQQIFEV